jgi:mediator of RNA polymerase II transcription subunit 18, fungi type
MSSFNGPLPPKDALKPLCPANSYLLSAVVRVSDGTNPNLVAEGSQELEALRETMRGVVKLQNPDRLALDTRFK